MSLDIYLYSEYCPHCGRGDEEYWANITHNLTAMADEAGLYKPLWRPGENGVETAEQLIEPLEVGINMMEADPPRFQKHNASNGWGMYEHFVPWLKKLLHACKQHPEATVRVSV